MTGEQAPSYAVFDDYRYNLQIAVAVRWFVIFAWLLQFNYRPDFANPTYIPNTLLAVSLSILNGYVHWRVRRGMAVTRPWALALSVLDVTGISLGIWISSGFGNNVFVLYYPALAMFAVVFTSTRPSFAGVTVVAAVYTAISIFQEPSVDFAIKEEKILFIRIVTMYAVVTAVNLIYRLERVKRREAVDAARNAERALQLERIRISEEIHDGAAQSACVISLGLETCQNLVKEKGSDLADRLEALSVMAKQALWELRYPINLGPVFEGRDLIQVLRTHVAAFKTITSVPTTLSLSGEKRVLPVMTSQRLFPMAHNALTNAYRHADASKVEVAVMFEDENVSLSVKDNGVGLPSSDLDSFPGHGLRNIRRTAEGLGGKSSVASGPGNGTTVMMTLPLTGASGGST